VRMGGTNETTTPLPTGGKAANSHAHVRVFVCIVAVLLGAVLYWYWLVIRPFDIE
jgi:hypothetical protein